MADAPDLSSFRTFITSVREVAQVRPHLRRITVAGGDLATYEPAGPDTFLYVLLPPPGKAELTIDQSFSWTEFYDMADDVRPVGAYYSQRAWRPESAELDLLFVLHGHDGPASAPARCSHVTSTSGPSAGSGCCSASSSTSATRRTVAPVGRASRMEAAAGSPVSSATSRYQSVSADGAHAVRGPHKATGSPGWARWAHADAGPSSPCSTKRRSSSADSGRQARWE